MIRKIEHIPLIVLIALIWINGAALAQSSTWQATIVSTVGDVQVKQSAVDVWAPASGGLVLKDGSEIVTKADGYCVVTLGYKNRNAFRVNGNSHIVLKDQEPTFVEIKQGTALFLVRQLENDQQFQVKSPTAVAACRGTGWLQGTDFAQVFDEQVSFTANNGFEEIVKSSEHIVLGSNGELTVEPGVDDIQMQDWKGFVQYLQNLPGAEDFVYVRNDKEDAIIKLYTRISPEEYEQNESNTWHEWLNDNQFIIRYKGNYQIDSEESIDLDQGIIKTITVRYADVDQDGKLEIVELFVDCRVAVQVDDNGQIYGLRFALVNKYQDNLDQGDEGVGYIPPPLPEAENESGTREVNRNNPTAPAPKNINVWNQVNVSGFGSVNNTNIPAMAEFQSYMYQGTTNTTDGAKLYRSNNGSLFTEIDLTGVAGFPGNVSIESMVTGPLPETASSRFYIGTAQDTASATAGSVFVSVNGSTFTELNGAGKWVVANDGANDSPAVTALIVYGNYLYAGVSFARFNAEIWRRPINDDSAAWENVVSKTDLGTITGGSKDGRVNDFTVFNGSLYAAIESTVSGIGPVMIFSASGDNGSWAQSGTRAFA